MSEVFGLHYGLNKLGFVPPKPVDELRHAENDAKFYHSICEQLGWESNLHLAKEATVSSFLDNIIGYSKKCRSDDLLIITFSGHGTRIADINGDEEDDYDEVLVFFDKLLLDDQVKVQFSRFEEGVNILFITDCCHSGTISRLLEVDNQEEVEYFERGFSAAIGQKIFDANNEYKIIKQNINEESVNVVSSVIHIAACQDDETASDGSVIMKHGLLTHRILKTWEEGNFDGNYQKFFDSVEKQMGGNQNPKLSFEGIINEKFVNGTPFRRVRN